MLFVPPPPQCLAGIADGPRGSATARGWRFADRGVVGATEDVPRTPAGATAPRHPVQPRNGKTKCVGNASNVSRAAMQLMWQKAALCPP